MNELRSSRTATAIDRKVEKVVTTDALAGIDEPGTAMNKQTRDVIYIDDYNSEDQIMLANASINKKPVRGLIRKVKGLFESNDDNDPAPENKKGIRIAAFEIGLK